MSEETKDMLLSDIQDCDDCGTVDLCDYHNSEIESLNDLGV